MDRVAAHLKLKVTPLSNEKSIITGEKNGIFYRFSVLTDCLLRIELSENGVFADYASQTVINRAFPETQYQSGETDGRLFVETAKVRLEYRDKISVTLLENQAVWHEGDGCGALNLGGTCRTLDGIDGVTGLEPGIIGKYGYAVLDDSKTLLIGDDGWTFVRSPHTRDFYYFGYGHDYKRALRDYYRLTGAVPLLPRFAFGNWWSRYYRYSEEEYKALIERFIGEEIPFTVAVVDMDWHIVDNVPEAYIHDSGRHNGMPGWTGYTWNADLFPDSVGFMAWLHDHWLRITLNVHPADGIRGYEDIYPDFARAMGVDPESKEWIRFRIDDPAFLRAYFEVIHHQMEDEGVDFWWLDWQQGRTTSTPGLDPLWMLNHFHFLDSGRDDSHRRGGSRRKLTFSRYAGPGSHRYPIGFSGDSIISWESLAFQPHFTSTASNIGYAWWSHDIGGHMLGCCDDELSCRWVQLGVFSPINRLHSSNNRFNGKEPWNYRSEVADSMKKYLRLRHSLVPYLYTMNFHTAFLGEPLCRPMYYEYPDNEYAYQVPNQYLFGTELIVAPITEPACKATQMGSVKAFVPAGDWFDFETGFRYAQPQDADCEGRACDGRMLTLWRTLDSYPVLARAGAIIPLSGDTGNGIGNPQTVELIVFGGKSNTFTLIEDDGDSPEEVYADPNNRAETTFDLDWGNGTFTIRQTTGKLDYIPAKRNYKITFRGIGTPDVWLGDVDIMEETVVPFNNILTAGDQKALLETLLRRCQINYSLKDILWEMFAQCKHSVALAERLNKENAEDVAQVLSAIGEIMPFS